VATPKLANGNYYDNSRVYKYYAGYSDRFVINQLTEIGKDSVLLDPWNGSGTTTLVASICGYNCYGYDINPVMVLVAKAKLYCSIPEDDLEISDAVSKSRMKKHLVDTDKDPLCSWFDDDTAKAIRSLEKTLRVVCGNFSDALMRLFANIDAASPRLAFYYVVLFELLRDYTSSFSTSNPTWIKVADDQKAKIAKTYSEISRDYMACFKRLSLLVTAPIKTDSTIIHTGDSRSIQLTDQIIDGAITSPPYCTRIDYAIYTRVELALIGYDSSEFNSVRKQMIGTPTIHAFDFSVVQGQTSSNTLT